MSSIDRRISEIILDTMQSGKSYTTREIASLIQLPLENTLRALYALKRKNKIEDHKVQKTTYWNLSSSEGSL